MLSDTTCSNIVNGSLILEEINLLSIIVVTMSLTVQRNMEVM